jgi:predicted esterase YcpF (UPF0227 family)
MINPNITPNQDFSRVLGSQKNGGRNDWSEGTEI